MERDRIIAALAGYKRPEVRLNPVDVGRLFNSLAKWDPDPAQPPPPFAPISGVPIVSDSTVAVGQMRVVETAVQPLAAMPIFAAPPTIKRSELAFVDWMRSQVPSVGMSESVINGIDLAARAPRRPWSLVGRRRTRGVWRRKGRR